MPAGAEDGQSISLIPTRAWNGAGASEGLLERRLFLRVRTGARETHLCAAGSASKQAMDSSWVAGGHKIRLGGYDPVTAMAPCEKRCQGGAFGMANPWTRDRAALFYLGFGLVGLAVAALSFGVTYLLPMEQRTFFCAVVRPFSWRVCNGVDLVRYLSDRTGQRPADIHWPNARKALTRTGTVPPESKQLGIGVRLTRDLQGPYVGVLVEENGFSGRPARDQCWGVAPWTT